MQKTPEHWENLRRSKSYLADDYFPPRILRDGNLLDMFETKQNVWKSD